MRKPIIVAVLLLATTTLFADGFRIGASVTAEFADRPNVKTFKIAIDDPMSLIPGQYWELTGKNVGFGMTYLVDVETIDVAAPVHKEIRLDWISTADLRYHILGSETYLDPFVEAGFGAAGRSDITNYEKVGAGTNDYTPTNLSLFGQVGAGLAF